MVLYGRFYTILICSGLILCKNINKNISYEYLKDIVWINKDISDSTVRDVVSRLKKKLDDINIENIYNFGYVLKK